MIKIDKSFVMEMAVDASDAAIVRSTIDLAHNLGLKVVAEGVESEDAWRHLEALGCDFAQGYYLSRPLPAEAATRLIRERGTGRDVAPPTLRVVQGLGALDARRRRRRRISCNDLQEVCRIADIRCVIVVAARPQPAPASRARRGRRERRHLAGRPPAASRRARDRRGGRERSRSRFSATPRALARVD